MCYSAQIAADYRKFVKASGARLSLRDFAELYLERANGSKPKIPKAMDAAFADPHSEEQREIKAAINRYNAEQATALEQELFKQRTRPADAERTLQTKATEAATESKRIATDKIDATIRRLDDPPARRSAGSTISGGPNSRTATRACPQPHTHR